MTDYKKNEINIFNKACLCRAFEKKVYNAVKNKEITILVQSQLTLISKNKTKSKFSFNIEDIQHI